jgi:hypothetical protein
LTTWNFFSPVADAELVLEGLDQLGHFENGHLLDGSQDLLDVLARSGLLLFDLLLDGRLFGRLHDFVLLVCHHAPPTC